MYKSPRRRGSVTTQNTRTCCLRIGPLRASNLKVISCNLGNKMKFQDNYQQMLRCSGQGVHVVWKKQNNASQRLLPPSSGQNHDIKVIVPKDPNGSSLFWGSTWVEPRPTRSLTQVHSISRSTSVSKIEQWTWNRLWQIRVHSDNTQHTSAVRSNKTNEFAHILLLQQWKLMLYVSGDILNRNYCYHVHCSTWHASRLGMQPIVQPICNYVRDTKTRIRALCGHSVLLR